MPTQRPIIVEENFGDFLGGVNRTFSEDLLKPNEVYSAQNARPGRYGSFEKRSGSQRLHTSAIASGATVNGVFQWTKTDGTDELVAVSGGNFYYKTLGATDFTEVSASISTSVAPTFVAYKDQTGTSSLYFVDGSSMYKWDGSTLSTVSAAPTLKFITLYHNRVWGHNGDKWLYYSALFDPENWSVASGAGQAEIETYDSEPIKALCVVGGALLIFKADSISRLQGYSIADIEIDTDTEGVSAEAGLVATHAFVRVEDVVCFMSDHSVMMATEAAVRDIGLNIETAFDEMNRTQIGNARAAHLRNRKEVWFFIAASGDTANSEAWVYNYRMNSWWGPHSFTGYNVSCVSRYERADGTESLMVGGYDGFVRDIDIETYGSLDDVLLGGSGGAKIPMSVEFRSLVFQSPASVKIGNLNQVVSADLGSDGQLVISWSSELQDQRDTTIDTRGPGMREYLFRPSMRGRRLTLTVSDYTNEQSRVNGVFLRAKLGRVRHV